jgi:hypothetical protein
MSASVVPFVLSANREAARMKTDNRSGRRRRNSKNRGMKSYREAALRIKLRWLFAICAAIVCLGSLVARNVAQLVDSGWAVSSPSPLATGSGSTQQDLVIRHVLEQTRQPLLTKKPSTQAPTAKNGTTDEDVRFANRAEAAKVDGWRPAGPSLAPATDSSSAEAAAPQAVRAPASSKRAFEFECDCNGMNAAGERRAETAQLPAHAGPNLSPAQEPVTSDQAQAANPSIEELTADDAPQSTTVDPHGSAATEDQDSPAPTEATDNQPTETITDVDVTPLPAAPAQQPPAQPARIAPIAPPVQQPGATAPSPSSPAVRAPVADVSPPSELPPLSRQMIGLKNRVRTVLKGYYRKALNSRENDPWESMHGMLAYGVHSRIHDGGPNGQLITSVGWLCFNKPCKGQTLLYVTPSGELRAKYGVGLQGHLGQFLAMLAQCHVSPDYPIHVADHEFTVRDLIEAEKKTCYPKSELTFKLIALQHYADLNDTWVNDQGLDWDFPKLISEELAQPIRGAACGGTHRLSGLSLVVKTRIRRGEPLDGEYKRANDFVKKYQQYAFRLQNRDGSLSTSWFRGAGDEDDNDRRIKTTGHILEWLCYSLSDEELRDQRTVRAVTYLANLMYSNYDHDWEIGPRAHATHALLLYDQRVFQPYDKEGEMASYRPSPTVAKRPMNAGTGTIRR